MRQPTLRILALGAACLLPVGCSLQGHGTSDPPKALGAVSQPLFGCPDIQGTYAWPPTQGHYSKAEAPPRIRQPRDAGFPVAIHSSAAQIWISQRTGGFTFRNRPVYAGDLPSNPALMQWGFNEVSRAEYACTSGGIEVDLGEVPDAIKKKEQYGGKGATYGYRIVRMSDGAIAARPARVRDCHREPPLTAAPRAGQQRATTRDAVSCAG